MEDVADAATSISQSPGIKPRASTRMVFPGKNVIFASKLKLLADVGLVGFPTPENPL